MITLKKEYSIASGKGEGEGRGRGYSFQRKGFVDVAGSKKKGHFVRTLSGYVFFCLAFSATPGEYSSIFP